MTTSPGTSFAKDRLAGENSHSATSNTHSSPQSVPNRILYEQPLNERIRTFLRLEYLFKQAGHHLKGDSEWDSRATLTCILDILAIFGTTNLKTEVLKELARNSTTLLRLEPNPDLDYSQLSSLQGVIKAPTDQMKRIDRPIARERKKS